jgi:hypothetical protein
MGAILRALFPPAVKAGDEMIFDGDDRNNPFARPLFSVVVQEVRGNWIRYRYKDGTSEDQNLDKRSFAFCYRKPNEQGKRPGAAAGGESELSAGFGAVIRRDDDYWNV